MTELLQAMAHLVVPTLIGVGWVLWAFYQDVKRDS
jgi:hypothetical protein